MSSVEVAALRTRAAGLRDAARTASTVDVSSLFGSPGVVWASPRVDRLVGELRVALGALGRVADEVSRVEALAAGLERRADELERSML